MSIGSNIKKYRQSADLTLDEVAKKIGVSRQTMSRYETGVIANIPSDKIEAIARVLDVSPSNLMDWSVIWEADLYEDYATAKDDSERRQMLKAWGVPADKKTDAARLLNTDSQLSSDLPTNAIPFTAPDNVAPILGRIPAGYPIMATTEIEGYAPIDYADVDNYFWLRVSGDSMINADIHDGDLVLIRRQECAHDGQVVAARINGDEATLKRFRRSNGTVMLIPENPKYLPIPVSAEAFKTGEASIIGIVVELKRKFI